MNNARITVMKESNATYEAVTEDVRIMVQPFYLEEESDPDAGRYFWAYQVMIENLGRTVVQLKSRYWRITDSRGRVEEVQGDGVIGEQPFINPGYTFEYTSGAPLATESGFMEGHYQMHRDNGTVFTAKIPPFSLDSPYGSQILN